MGYLVQYKFTGVFDARVMMIDEVADLIGFSDCNEASDFTVYRLVFGKDPERLFWEKESCQIWLYDRYGSLVDHCEYDEH